MPIKRKRKHKKLARKVCSNWESMRSTIAPENARFKKRREERCAKSKPEEVLVPEEPSSNIGSASTMEQLLLKHRQKSGMLDITTIFALDCEMVGVGIDDRSILARCTIVDGNGKTVYDKHVQPVKGEKITNYRTWVSGIRPKDVRKGSSAISFKIAQREVAALLKDQIVVGHALKNDFRALMLTHPPQNTRDTARFKPLLRVRKQGSFKVKHRPQKLKKLTLDILGIEIQAGEHDSAHDARAALLLYYKFQKVWEAGLKKKLRKKKKSRPSSV